MKILPFRLRRREYETGVCRWQVNYTTFFNRAKIGGAGATISCPAFEKEGHFRHHSETTVILSFTNNHHMGEITGGLHSLRGKLWGICCPILRGHSERTVIIIPMRSSYRVSRSLFSTDCLMFNWCHTKGLYFEHQTAGTRRRRAKHQPIFSSASFR